MNRASGRSSGFAQQGGCSGFPFPGALDADQKKKREFSGVTTYSSFPRKRESRGCKAAAGSPCSSQGAGWTPAFKLGHAGILPGQWEPLSALQGGEEGAHAPRVRAERGPRTGSGVGR